MVVFGDWLGCGRVGLSDVPDVDPGVAELLTADEDEPTPRLDWLATHRTGLLTVASPSGFDRPQARHDAIAAVVDTRWREDRAWHEQVHHDPDVPVPGP